MESEESIPAAWFGRWWEPEEFVRVVHHHASGLSPLEHVDGPRFQRARDGYVAGFFALIRAQHSSVPVLLRLEPDRFPDFNLRVGETDAVFEVVEALRPGRRRGDEYREAAAREAQRLPPRLGEVDPVAEQRMAVSAIVAVLKSKAGKRYRPAPCLLVYVNLWLVTEVDETIPPEILQATAEYRRNFPELWLLWSHNAMRCWPDPRNFSATRVPPEIRDGLRGGLPT